MSENVERKSNSAPLDAQTVERLQAMVQVHGHQAVAAKLDVVETTLLRGLAGYAMTRAIRAQIALKLMGEVPRGTTTNQAEE